MRSTGQDQHTPHTIPSIPTLQKPQRYAARPSCYTRPTVRELHVVRLRGRESMKPTHIYRVCVVFIGLLVVTSAAAGQEQSLTFRRAVELALGHSSEMALSRADEIRAYQTYLEAHDSYVPKVAIGSDIGYAYGFPLSLEGSAPTLFNVTTQSSVWNLAQREFNKAAKAEWGA